MTKTLLAYATRSRLEEGHLHMLVLAVSHPTAVSINLHPQRLAMGQVICSVASWPTLQVKASLALFRLRKNSSNSPVHPHTRCPSLSKVSSRVPIKEVIQHPHK